MAALRCRSMIELYLVVENLPDAIECNDDRLHRVRHNNFPSIDSTLGARKNYQRRRKDAAEYLYEWKWFFVYNINRFIVIDSTLVMHSYLIIEVFLSQSWLTSKRQLRMPDRQSSFHNSHRMLDRNLCSVPTILMPFYRISVSVSFCRRFFSFCCDSTIARTKNCFRKFVWIT